ncbi:PAS domain-containing protein [Ktedonosporobacter rubrisoli]|uniref:histidine kinase n=1 Tax=Ktedonosporobacter rubrisoli TaxID=2509675 RepID=A0A4P6K418_KTERU|nr:ATP-binding protein [Ktedonosporobacter rubrisoli]QBD83028.1 PAS domain-containing protein [Ktedonosporobacter rubrisoli]
MSINAQDYHLAELMLEHTSVGMAIYDAHDMRLLQANTLFLSFFRNYFAALGQEEHKNIIGHTFCDWLTSAQKREMMGIFHTVVETGTPYHGNDFSLPDAHGEPTYWHWSLNPVRDEHGQTGFLVLTVSEVTEQVLARQQAEQAQSALSQTKSLLEAERDRLEVIETVARSVREALSPERISGVAVDAIAEHFHAESVCLHIADPNHRALRLLRSRMQTRRQEAPGTIHYIPYEHMLPGSNAGEPRDPIVVEDIQNAAIVGTIRKEHPLVLGGTRGFICVPLWFRDHFEGTLSATFTTVVHKQGPEVRTLTGCATHLAAALAHARLLTAVESERTRLRDILDQLPEGILIAEISNGTISYANPAAAGILGIPLEELSAFPLHRYSWSQIYRETALDGQPIPPWNFIVIRALCGETIRSKETLVVKPCGSKLVTLASSAPLYSESGIMTGAVIVFQDVTAQKSLEQHKNEFFSIANHELRTPITIIQGFAEILQLAAQNRQLDSLTQYALASISEQSQQLTRLIEEMLDISRLEQAQFTLKRAEHDLVSLVKHVIESHSITTRQHHLHFVLEGLQSADSLISNIDEKRIVQVLNNLINNAIKYSPTGGRIEVGLRYKPDKPDTATIWVKDEGIGIAPAEMPHIFKRFHRARDLDRSMSGFGIGLYLVKEVIGRHGGHIRVDSIEGQGSTFYVTLPLNTQ